jgi:transposase-like protein
MSKVEVVCPFCRESNAVEKYSFSGALKHGLPEIKCPHCSKSWGQNVIETGSLAKSAPSSELAELRVQNMIVFREISEKLEAQFHPQLNLPRARGSIGTRIL